MNWFSHWDEDFGFLDWKEDKYEKVTLDEINILFENESKDSIEIGVDI